MTEIVKGALAGAWTWLIAFVFPAALWLGALGVALKLEDPDPPLVETWATWSNDSRVLAAGSAAITLGMVLLGVNNALHRVLEGHVIIPRIKPLWNCMCDRHSRKLDSLKSQLKSLEQDSLQAALLVERIQRYPRNKNAIGPTTYANAIRSFETYGAVTFGLDSQTLWHELAASAPEAARIEEAGARSYVDMLVNLLYLSLAFGIIAILRLFWESSLSWWIGLLVSGILVLGWYLLAVRAAYEWAGAVRALVNLGRKPLAENLDLQLPTRLADETRMWHEFVWLVRDGKEPMDALAQFRQQADSTDALDLVAGSGPGRVSWQSRVRAAQGRLSRRAGARRQRQRPGT